MSANKDHDRFSANNRVNMTFKGNEGAVCGDSLTRLRFHPSIRKISPGVFAFCPLLREVTMPSTVTSIGDSTFLSCTSLVEIRFSNGLRVINKDGFHECKSLRHVSLPATLESICATAFSDCVSLEVAELPHGLKELGPGVFLNCKSLKQVSIPATVPHIQRGTFENCTSLVDVELNEGLQIISDRAFFRCESLCALSIPSTCYKIGAKALYGCNSLVGVEIANDTPISFCFQACPRLINLSIPITFDGMESLEPFQGCNVLGVDNASQKEILSKVQDRFQNLPIHKQCYHASTTDAADFDRQIQSFGEEEKKNNHKDAYGMTPFHIVATSAKLRTDLLQILLDGYNLETMGERDSNGETIMDYLLFHGSSKAIPLIQLVLQKVIVEQMITFGLSNWQSDVSSMVESLDWNQKYGERRSCLDKVVGKVALYAKLQTSSLVELALWKNSIKSSFDPNSSKRLKLDRESCRMTCAAQVVIPSVIGYLFTYQEDIVDWSMVPPNLAWLKEQKLA